MLSRARLTSIILALAATFFFITVSPASSQLAADPESVLDLDGDAVASDRFGEVVARGDFNGDDWDDLAVTAQGYDVGGFASAGAVFVFYGAEAGLAISPGSLLTAEDALAGSDCARPSTLAGFGAALAVADFNGDGREDLAVGAPKSPVVEDEQELREVGSVSVFWGGADSSFTAARCFIPQRDGLPGDLVRFGEFGYALAAGDFESDGVPDLAIGAPGAPVNGTPRGAVTVVYGRPGVPLDAAESQFWHQDSPGIDGVAEDDDRFGAALATGDLVLGLDTACDLVIGVPNDSLEEEGVGLGSVHVIFGCTEDGLSPDSSVRWTAEGCLLNGEDEDAFFGTALAVGDFDGQGADDLAIGAPGHPLLSEPFGSVCVLYGNQQQPQSVTSQALNRYESSVASEGDDFGAALATLAVAGEMDRLLVGAPGGSATDNEPAFLLYQPQPGGGFDSFEGLEYRRGAGLADDALGTALVAGHFDARGPAVVAGAPDLDRGGLDKAGGVWLLPRAALFADGFESGSFGRWSSVVGD